MDDHQRLDLTERALDMALQHRRPRPGLTLHHDRGSQYTAARYRAKAEAAKITLSMSRPSMPYDNAMAESFFATLKLEIGDGRPFANRNAARTAVFEYVELFYNRIRMHSSLGYRSPMQAERDYQLVRPVFLTTCLWNPGRSNLTPLLLGVAHRCELARRASVAAGATGLPRPVHRVGQCHVQRPRGCPR